MSATTIVTNLGLVEGASHLFRSGSRRRAVLAANHATCDLYVYGEETSGQACGLLRMYNPKSAPPLRCVQVLRPQLLDHSFVSDCPGFWSEAPQAQARLVSDKIGPDTCLDIPHEVVELRLHEASGLAALVGVHQVSILVLPPASSVNVAAADTGDDDLGTLLSCLGLGEYTGSLRHHGYSHVPALLRMNASERERMMGLVDMLPGHVQTLSMHLEGRLPAVASVTRADPDDDEEAIVCWALRVPLPFPRRAATIQATGDGMSDGNPVAPVADDDRTTCRSPASAFWRPTPNGTEPPLVGAPTGSASPTVMQVEWHPLGDSHLGILLSDGTFHLVDTANDLHEPVLSLHVPLVDPARPSDAHGEGGTAVSFSFGAPTLSGWSSLCVFFATSIGHVYVACPVLPSGERARRHLRSLAPLLEATLGTDSSSEAARAWLQQQQQQPPPAALRTRVAPAGSPTLEMQGPLHMGGASRGTEGAAASPTRARARAEVGETLALACLPLPAGLTAAIVGRTDRTISIGIFTGTLGPRWLGNTPLPPSHLSAAMATPSAAAARGALRASAACSAASRGTPTDDRRRSSFGIWEPVVRGRPPRPSRAEADTPLRGLDATVGATETADGAHGLADTSEGAAPGSLGLLALSVAHLGDPSTTRAGSEPLRWMRLTPDGLATDRVFVHTSAGALHLLRFPWLNDWALYLQRDDRDTEPAPTSPMHGPPQTPPAECDSEQLLSPLVPTAGGSLASTISSMPEARMQRTAGVVGVVTLRDPALGDAVLAMRNDGTCTRLQLFPHAASIPEEACLSGGARVQAHHEVALKGLAHHRDTAYHVDNMAWAQSKARLESATPYDVLPAFEQALASLAGPGSTLRRRATPFEPSRLRRRP